MTALNKKLARDLWHMRGQLITVALVVACGIATYVTMRGAYESVLYAQQDYYSRYRFADVFDHLTRAPDSLAASIASIPGVSSVQTRVVVEVTLDVPGLDEPALGRIISIPERAAPMLNSLCIRSGGYLDPGRRDGVIVSESFAKANKLNVGDTIGAVINGRWERLQIAGVAISPEYVYEIRGTEVFPDNRRFGVMWMSREALGPPFNMEGAFNDLTLSLAPGASEADVITRLDTLLDPYGGLGAYGRYDQLSNRFLSDEIVQDRITGIFIPTIFLGVAAFLIHVVLSRLVNTQRAPIGLLKAFGYSNLSIGLHYLKYALTAVLMGTIVGAPFGIWLGRGLAKLYEDFFRFPELRFISSPGMIGSAILISAVAACLGALGALRSVVALPPAEAMRPEAPARFRPGFAERLGLQRFLSISARMILRNLERRPGKALISTLALALAGAILVVGFYFYDGIDYMIRVEFQTASREDVAVTFNEPHGSSAQYAVAQLPGVMRTEAFRVVPVRLRFEHRFRRVAIMGLEPDRQLRRLIDLRLNAVDLPPEGVVLSSSLAKILGAAPGDRITAEVLEGRRPVRQVVVAGVVDDLIGASAYMDIHALNRLMEEGPTTSGAFLSVDPLVAERLYLFLKRTPAVSGVSVREAMLTSFRDTIARSLGISVGSLVGFACVIAFGMVYNGARITLSERSHELASLRVLGFTKAEVGWMLLGEQGLLAGVSIPLGFLFGYGICALLVRAMESELYRMPLVISGRTYAFSAIIVILASAFSGVLIFQRLRHLDLISVLKARE
ncbi:MAG: FtsX-like permease family protein [Acidobacteriia bacterium]|nr:FtsX-like permease family protein [Terriglobia bacterium]